MDYKYTQSIVNVISGDYLQKDVEVPRYHIDLFEDPQRVRRCLYRQGQYSVIDEMLGLHYTLRCTLTGGR